MINVRGSDDIPHFINLSCLINLNLICKTCLQECNIPIYGLDSALFNFNSHEGYLVTS